MSAVLPSTVRTPGDPGPPTGLTLYLTGSRIIADQQPRELAGIAAAKDLRARLANGRRGTEEAKQRQRPRGARGINLTQDLAPRLAVLTSSPRAKTVQTIGHSSRIGDLAKGLVRLGPLGPVVSAQTRCASAPGGASRTCWRGSVPRARPSRPRADLRLDPPPAHLLEAQPFPGGLAAGIVLEHLVQMGRRPAPSAHSLRTRAPASTGRRPCRTSGLAAASSPELAAFRTGSSWTWRATSSGALPLPLVRDQSQQTSRRGVQRVQERGQRQVLGPLGRQAMSLAPEGQLHLGIGILARFPFGGSVGFERRWRRLRWRVLWVARRDQCTTQEKCSVMVECSLTDEWNVRLALIQDRCPWKWTQAHRMGTAAGRARCCRAPGPLLGPRRNLHRRRYQG